jgi:recombination protein RecA
LSLTDKERFAAFDRISAKHDKENKTENSIVRINSKKITLIPSIPFGCPTVDYEVLQYGGIPRGRIIEIFGPESAGKTTTALILTAAEQALGGMPLYVDAEHALDPSYAKKLGVDLDRFMINQPNSGEQALKLVDDVVESEAASLIIVDSAAALVPEAELAGEIGDAHVGLQARLMSQACRILTGKVSKTNTTLIFLNQIREKIGVMFGNPETTSGGRALKFYSSVRLKVWRGEALKENDKIIGHRIKLKAEKNRGGIPHRTTEVDLIYPGDGRKAGFDVAADTITYAAKSGLFETKGSWFYLNGERIANGLENLKALLSSNETEMNKLNASIKKHVEQISKDSQKNETV